MGMAARHRSVPSAAKWLGGLGAIPFVVCAGGAALAPPELAVKASDALAIYGAVILSFLGGIQWGFAIRHVGAFTPSSILYRRLSISVTPALVGWISLLLPRDIGFVALAFAFALVLMVDLRAARRQEAPSWYPRLRWPLTLTAVAALAFGAWV